MSLLSDYEQRTAWKYEPIHGSFHTHDGLVKKINPDGSYAPFKGSTVVFRAGNTCFQTIEWTQRILYNNLNEIGLLAFPLPESTIHMTLHDLVSPETCSANTAEEYEHEVKQSIIRASDIVEDIREKHAGRKITMVPDRIVNMVSKSLVLMLRPQTEQDYEFLLELYHRFDGIQNLSYPLTPHITLAYFKPGMIDGDALGNAVGLAQSKLERAPVFEFFPEQLTAQIFLDMKTYQDIPERICFCCDGGLNRSVMAAQILNHLAKERNLPVIGEARAAYPYTQGWPIRDQVWDTLESHGIHTDRKNATARYLQDEEGSFFSSFAGISDGALERILLLCPHAGNDGNVSSFFYGVRDPEYGDISHEQAFCDLYDRVEKYLDAFVAVHR